TMRSFAEKPQLTEPSVNAADVLITKSYNEGTVVAAPNYPRTINSPEGKVVIQMPQVKSWKNYEILVGWAVIEATPSDSDKAWIGAIKFKARSDINFEERLVIIHDIEVVESKFFDDTRPPESVLELARNAISLKPKSVPIDVVIRALPSKFEMPKSTPSKNVRLKHGSPKFYVSSKPAALMIINGDVVKAPIKGTRLEFVVNTNWDLIYDKASEYYYVLNGTTWQRTKSLLKPKWESITKLPEDFSSLPSGKNWQEAKKHVPAQTAPTKSAHIFVSFKPAELILTKGAPSHKLITNTGIEWVTNTESDLFRYQSRYYYLVAGRWFYADELKGSWSPVVKLPAIFSRIPDNHSKAHVLASISGTPAARAAIIEANIPRKASVSINAGENIKVIYDGEPKFVLIEKTGMKRAANSTYQVILVNGRYYLCFNGVWFVSGMPNGPWHVATSVPDEIYTIPASDPAHNVTYVYVVEKPAINTSTHVTYAYTSGYYGYYVYGTTVVYGTGWYYPPYYYYNPWGYPAYWHYPTSYGYGSWYNPTTGRYAERATVYGPYGGMAASSVYNPRTGTYGRGWSVWDSDEIARSGYAYNPNTKTYAAGNMYYDFDDNEGWRESYVERGDKWLHSETKYDGNIAKTEFETARGIEGTSKRVKEGDTITGSGNINYKDRSAQTHSKINSDGAELNIQGDQGGSVSFVKEFGEAASRGSITSAGGRSADFKTQLTSKGRATYIEGDVGGKAISNVSESGRVTLGKSASGDLYVGNNGNVYKRDGNGSWSQRQNGSWDSLSENRMSNNAASTQRYSSDRKNLKRQYDARRNGSRNYNQFQRQRSSMRSSMGRGSFGGRSRRRL
ncbi:MAG: hypothetical protein JKX87_06500, partial [Cycloclasticus sp.]|nr:hypothetical protein [Cycloclasticus sp.]